MVSVFTFCKQKTVFPQLVFSFNWGCFRVTWIQVHLRFFALELAEVIVHIQVKWVYAGAYAPPPFLSNHQCGRSHTYLPVKSFIPLIIGQWLYQQTASGGFFLHAFYTDYMDYCISRFWCIIFFLNVITLKLVVTKLFFSPVFLEDCFVLILSIWNNC